MKKRKALISIGTINCQEGLFVYVTQSLFGVSCISSDVFLIRVFVFQLIQHEVKKREGPLSLLPYNTRFHSL